MPVNWTIQNLKENLTIKCFTNTLSPYELTHMQFEWVLLYHQVGGKSFFFSPHLKQTGSCVFMRISIIRGQTVESHFVVWGIVCTMCFITAEKKDLVLFGTECMFYPCCILSESWASNLKHTVKSPVFPCHTVPGWSWSLHSSSWLNHQE